MTDALVRRAAEIESAQELSQLLRELRRRHARDRRESELTYRELAARTGWSHAAIAEYLTGRTLPPTDRLDGLLTLLGASPAELGAIASARDRIEESRRGGPAAGPSTVPRQLPAVAPHFVGRAAELAALSGLAERPPEAGMVVISAVAGMAGIGKTALAAYAGHRLAGRFPDGQLFVDLHGFTEGMRPVPPTQALERMLRDVGVPGERIPAGLEQRAGLWRSVLAGRRMLVVLDNAESEQQVQPLLPGASGCLVLVTSRRRLTGLDSTHAVSLDTLPRADAVDLFLRTADRPELSVDTPEVLEVVELCGRLPLAIRVAAARLKHRRVWTVADLLARLRDLALDDGVHATLDLSYQHLAPPAQLLYRLLGLHPGSDVDAQAAAALTGGTPEGAGRLLDGLVDDHMLQEPASGRFQFHDLVRAHAAKVVAAQEDQPRRRAALLRLLDHYRHTAAVAMTVAYPHERHRRPVVPPAPTRTREFGDRDEAQSWLDSELPNLLAATQQGEPEHTWDLSATIGEHLLTRGRYREAEALHQQALDLARRHGNQRAQIDALNGVGYIARIFGRQSQAGEHLREALRIAAETGDRVGELQALNWLGRTDRMLGRYELAADHHARALSIAREIGDRTGESQAHNGLGRAHRMLGRHELAADHHTRALSIAREIGDRTGQRQALEGLGHIHETLGRYEQAAEHYGPSLRIAREMGDRAGQVQSLTGLGDIHRLQGRYEQAAEYLGQALEIAEDINDRLNQLHALNRLGEVQLRLGRAEDAADVYRQALHLSRDVENDNWLYEALQGLGRASHAGGKHRLAVTHHKRALKLATELAQPIDQARAHGGLGHAHHALGQEDEARRHWQQALQILTDLGIDRTDDVETNADDLRDRLKI